MKRYEDTNDAEYQQLIKKYLIETRSIRKEHPLQKHYVKTYRSSVEWNGENLSDKTLLVYCEQGFGDIIQFIRYVPMIKAKSIILAIPEELFLLVSYQKWGVKVINANETKLPKHDYHAVTTDLPFFFAGIIPKEKYIKAPAFKDMKSPRPRVGLCWESGPNGPDYRNSLLKPLMPIVGEYSCYNLTLPMRRKELLKGCEEFKIYNIPVANFYDTARLIQSMDLVISVDTSVLHLSGAMGKRAIALLSHQCDVRWNGPSWYPCMELIKQTSEDNWESVYKKLSEKKLF